MNAFLQRDIDNFVGIDSFCFQNCLRIILAFQGLKYPEMYMNAALTIRYDIKNKKIGEGKTMRSLVPSENSHVKTISYEYNRDSFEVFIENLTYIKETGSPIMVGADTYYLPYATNFGKNHAKHAVIMCGYNEHKREVDVIDWYPTWYYKGSVKLEDFLAARSSENDSDGSMYSGEKVGNEWVVIEGVTQRNKEDLLLEVLQITQNEYYRGSDGYFLYGPEAIQTLDKIIDNCLEKEQFEQLHRKLFFCEKRYRFFCGYLDFAGKNNFEDEISCVKNSLINELEDWKVLLNLSAKGCVSQSARVRDKMKIRVGSILMKDNELEKSFRTLKCCVENR